MNDLPFVKKSLIVNIGSEIILESRWVRWRFESLIEAGCEMVVGLDYIKDNLDNAQDGACNRLLSRYAQGKESGKEKAQAVKSLLDNTLMVWCDCSENITDSTGGKDDLSKYYLNVLYGRIRDTEITNSKLKNFHNIGGNFDLVVSNFAIHYFFESEVSEASQKVVDDHLAKGVFKEDQGAIGIDLKEHKLGFYLGNYAGEDWLPIPFREILKQLHSDHRVNKPHSVLTKWNDLITEILQG